MELTELLDLISEDIRKSELFLRGKMVRDFKIETPSGSKFEWDNFEKRIWFKAEEDTQSKILIEHKANNRMEGHKQLPIFIDACLKSLQKIVSYNEKHIEESHQKLKELMKA